MSNAIRVGTFVVVFLALLMGAFVALGRNPFQAKPLAYYAVFEDAGGVVSGTAVQMAGVKIGQVERVELVGPNQARLHLAIDPDVKIPAGSEAQIASSLIGFGEIPVHIVAPDGVTTYLAVGDTLQGTRARALDNLLPGAEETLKELNMTLAAARGLMEDKALKGQIEELLATSTTTIARFEKLAASFDGLVTENRGSIKTAMASANSAMAEINRGTQMLTQLLADPKWQDQARAMLAQLNATGKKAEDLILSLDAFVNDPELREPLRRTMANVETITQTGTRAAASAEEMTANGVVLSQKAIELADNANAIAEEAKLVVKKIQDFFERVPSGVKIEPQYQMDLARETHPNYWRTDFTVKVPVRDVNIHAGIFDAFESNKLNLQLGKDTTWGEWRYGIFASKPGIGVNYRLAPTTSLRGDLFDINNPRLDLRLRHEFGREYVGWLGVNRIFNDNAVTLGIGVRR